MLESVDLSCEVKAAAALLFVGESGEHLVLTDAPAFLVKPGEALDSYAQAVGSKLDNRNTIALDCPRDLLCSVHPNLGGLGCFLFQNSVRGGEKLHRI